MDVYRISKKEYAAIDGIGGLFFSGRWHMAGTRVVYAAQHRSLAALEYLAHLSLPVLLTNEYVLATIRIPDSLKIKVLSRNDLKNDWTLLQNQSHTQKIGDLFLKSVNSVGLQVPSAIVYEEFNFILNPAFVDFKKCKIIDIQPFNFDARLMKV